MHFNAPPHTLSLHSHQHGGQPYMLCIGGTDWTGMMLRWLRKYQPCAACTDNRDLSHGFSSCLCLIPFRDLRHGACVGTEASEDFAQSTGLTSEGKRITRTVLRPPGAQHGCATPCSVVLYFATPAGCCVFENGLRSALMTVMGVACCWNHETRIQKDSMFRAAVHD
jgi:hypothetical protein